jgi:hypothetical protein
LATCRECFHFGVCQGDIPYYNSDAEKCANWACHKDIIVRPKGRWIWDKRFSDYTCSVCHNWDLKTPNFCSNCGADMRGESDE